MTTWTKTLPVGRACLGLGLFWATAAAAQSAPPPAPPVAEKPAAEKPAAEKPAAEKPAAPAPAAADSIRVERASSGQKLFRITEGLLVEGQRQKPNAFYVLQRASTPYDWEALDESFLPRILKSAEKSPFDGRSTFPAAPARPSPSSTSQEPRQP